MRIDYKLLGVSSDASQEEIRESLNTLLRKWYFRLNSPKLEQRQEAERMIQELEKIGDTLSLLETRTEAAQEMVEQATKLPRLSDSQEQESNHQSEADAKRSGVNEEEWREAVKAGQVEAMLELGSYLLQGNAIGQDQEGIYWLNKAAKAGSQQAMLTLGRYFFQRESQKEKKNGEYWLKKAVKAGSVEAIRELGLRSSSPKEKVKWLRKAGEAGDQISMKELGLRLLRGDGLKPSNKWGVYWLRKAAKTGELEAMRELGLYFLKKKDNGKQIAEGKQWLRQAAKLGDPIASQILAKQKT